jgi:hypothetical protein
MQHQLLLAGERIPTSCPRKPDVVRRIDPVVARVDLERSRDGVA